MRRALLVTLLSSMTLTAAAYAGTPGTDASAPTSRPVSTGVNGPRLVYSTHISIPAGELPAGSNPARMVMKVNLDETGSPTNIRVIQPITQQIDARVVDAVRRFRWAPAVLDNNTVPYELTLVVEVQR